MASAYKFGGELDWLRDEAIAAVEALARDSRTLLGIELTSAALRPMLHDCGGSFSRRSTNNVIGESGIQRGTL